MEWICWFRPCSYIHIVNIPGVRATDPATGLYQCRRCKEISRGKPRYCSTRWDADTYKIEKKNKQQTPQTKKKEETNGKHTENN